jgi:uncharacterized membrane protein YedE/YeeE
MNNFPYLNALAGGTLIGVAVVLMFLGNGRITGISGIVGSVVKPEKGQTLWRVVFIISLILGGTLYPLLWGKPLPVEINGPWYLYLIAGLVVGFGTRTGSGCTSGHGICGIARFSPRSLVATVTFILAAMITHTLVNAIAG